LERELKPYDGQAYISSDSSLEHRRTDIADADGSHYSVVENLVVHTNGKARRKKKKRHSKRIH